jgi:hypothetical protein
MQVFLDRSGCIGCSGTKMRTKRESQNMNRRHVPSARRIIKHLAESVKCVQQGFLAKKHSVGIASSLEAKIWAIPAI